MPTNQFDKRLTTARDQIALRQLHAILDNGIKGFEHFIADPSEHTWIGAFKGPSAFGRDDALEAARLLCALGLDPEAKRLVDEQSSFANRRFDAGFMELARGKSDEFRDELTGAVGPFPLGSDDDAAFAELQDEQLIAIIGHASKLVKVLKRIRDGIEAIEQGGLCTSGSIASLRAKQEEDSKGSASQGAATPDPIHLAFECADAIDRLPGQLSALFKKGASAEGRLESISTACLKIQIGLRPVTNYIERNQPHVLAHHVQQTQSLLIGIEKFAVRGDSDETRKGIVAMGVIAHTVTEWLRGWAEEQRTNQGQIQRPKDSASIPEIDVDSTASIKRPSDDAITAWRLCTMLGLNRTQAAQQMSQELGKKVNQGSVSRWVPQVQAYMDATGNSLPGMTTPISKPQNMDPTKLDLGERTDGRPLRQRQTRAPNSG